MNGARALGMIVIAAVAGVTYASAAEAPVEDSIRIGRKIQDFSLKNQFGKEYTLHDFADRDVVVVAFVGDGVPSGPALWHAAGRVGEEAR